MKRIFLIIILLFSIQILFGQDYESKYNTRTVMINYPDSVIKAKILNTQKDFKVDDELIYYWYNDNKIGSNRGGFIGKPLHGTYIVCTNDGVLIKQGEFENGLKTGKWKTWYLSGELRSIETYKSGLKNDIHYYYSEEGEILKEIKFKNGKTVELKEGSFLNSIFKKKDKELSDDSIKTKIEEDKID